MKVSWRQVKKIQNGRDVEEREISRNYTRNWRGVERTKIWNAGQRACKVTQGLGQALHAAGKICGAPCWSDVCNSFPPFPKTKHVLYLSHRLFVPRALKIIRSLSSLFYILGKYKPQAWLPVSWSSKLSSSEQPHNMQWVFSSMMLHKGLV